MRKFSYLIVLIMIFLGHSKMAFADGDLKKIQTALQANGLYKGEASGEINLDTVAALSASCDLYKTYCDESRKLASTFYFNRYNNVRYALITNKETYHLFEESFNFLKEVNSIESNGWSFISAYMRGATVSSIHFDQDVQDVFYYNPIIDITLVLHVSEGSPRKAFFVSGESIRGESHSGRDFPQWIRDKSNPFARMETATKAIHKISRETQASIVKSGISKSSSLLNESENNLIRNRLAYLFNGLSDEIGSCAKFIDNLVKVPGGMSSIEKKYNQKDPNAGVAASIVPFIPVGQFIFEDGIFRLYASQMDPEHISALFIKNWTEESCTPDLFFYPDLRSL